MRLARRGRQKNKISNNRFNIIMAIIFLLSFFIIYRLFELQVKNSDYYQVLAQKQHFSSSELEPLRGRIFIQDNKEIKNGGELYPLAANKDFALVFAQPNKIENANEVAKFFYETFSMKRVEKEVSEMLEENEQLQEETEEFRKVKRELEIKFKKEEILKGYLEKLTKKGDPFEPLEKKVNEEELEKIKEANFTGIDYLMETYRYYPENNIGSHMTGFVGFSGDGKKGLYGLEGFFNEDLSGKFGSYQAARSATGQLIVLEEDKYKKAENGSDLILTINRSIQFFACNKLNETALRYGADGGSVIIIDPNTGAIISLCSWPDYDPNNYQEVEDAKIYNNPAIFYQYEPGSVFKAITMAAAIDQDKVTPSTTYNDQGYVMIEGWPKPIKNSDYERKGGWGVVNMNTVLEESLNTGAIFAMKKIGPEIFGHYVKNFGFGEKTGIELETETPGNINNLIAKKIKPIDAATASFGQGIAVTPLQLVNAFASIANGGIFLQPFLVKEIINADGSVNTTKPRQIRRVISERTATLLTGMLVNVIEGGHAKRAAVEGYYVAGKTGTAQVASSKIRGYGDRTIHTFVGFAPVNEPKFVMLVKLDDPKSVEFAASSAAPLFGEIAEFVLNYYQAPKER